MKREKNKYSAHQQVWSSRRFDLHAAFALERADRHVNSLTCRVTAHQPGSAHRQVLRVALADLRITVRPLNVLDTGSTILIGNVRFLLLRFARRRCRRVRACRERCAL